jgi:hypothetical protein
LNNEGRGTINGTGADISDLEAHATNMWRAPGFILVLAASYLPGKPASMAKPHRAFSLDMQSSSRMHLNAVIYAAAGECDVPKDVVAAVNDTLIDLYSVNPGAAFPVTVDLNFVPNGIEVNRQDWTWRLGKVAHIRFWFPCGAKKSDQYFLQAYLTLVHELTHAAEDYRGRKAGDLPNLTESERIADGASACFYLLMRPPLGDQLRTSADASKFFVDPIDASRNYQDKHASC